MTHHDDSPDERAIQALFDATAEEPTDMQLRKLEALAADIPGQRRAPFWAFVFGGSFAAAIAAAAIIAFRPSTAPPPSASTPTASIEAPSAMLLPQAVAASLEVPSGDVLDTNIDDDVGDDLGFGGIDGPDDDEDADAWLLAAAEVLEAR